MRVYVETNFVLELALAQEQSESCRSILSHCRAADAELIVPTYSLVEPLETLTRRGRERRRFLNRNTKDFDDPDIVAELASLGCKLLPRFDHGLAYIQAQRRELDSADDASA